MNTLRIKLNPYKDINIISLDDKPLSSYSELNSFMKEPFLNWADKLLDVAANEINDDFNLVVSAGEFEAKLLKGIQNNFDSCISYRTEALTIDEPASERLIELKMVASNHNVNLPTDHYKLPTYSDIQLSLDADCVQSTSIEKATLIVTDNTEVVSTVKNTDGPKIIVVTSGRNNIEAIGNQKYLWEIEEDELTHILRLIIDRFVKTPLVKELASLLENKASNMNDGEREALALSTEVDAFVLVSDIPDIEIGETIPLDIKMYPSYVELPNIRIAVQNPEIASISGTSITAIAPGTTTVEIYKAAENIPFTKKRITTFQDNCVRKIDLSIPSKQMGAGKKQKVTPTFYPADAEDISSVVWSSDNENVAVIDKSGIITARNEGTVTITAKTKRACGSISIKILPQINSISISSNDCHLFVGQTQPLTFDYEPKNAFDTTCEWLSSDKSVAIIDKQDDGQTIIRATGIGTCTLACTAKDGGCTAKCNVVVESTFKKQENAHQMLSLTAVLAIACLFCSVLSLQIACIPLALATIVAGILAIKKNFADRFWAFLLMAASVLITLLATGVIKLF